MAKLFPLVEVQLEVEEKPDLTSRDWVTSAMMLFGAGFSLLRDLLYNTLLLV